MRITRPKNIYNPTSPDDSSDFHIEEKKSHFSFMLKTRFILLACLLLALIYWFWQSSWINTYGRVMATESHLASTKVGRIAEIIVKEGDPVKKGQLVALLENKSLKARLESRALQLKKGEVRLLGLVSRGINPMIPAQIKTSQKLLEEARQRLKAAKADYYRSVKNRDQAKLEVKRMRKLKLLDSVTQKKLETSQQILIGAQAELNIAFSFMKERRAGFDRAKVTLIQAQQNQAFSQSKLDDEINLQQLENQRLKLLVLEIKSQLAETEIHSPINGFVAWLNKHQGDVVDHNDIIMNIMDPNKTWVEGYVDTDEWAGIGQNTEGMIKVDHEQGSWLTGCVIMPFPTERPIDQEYPVGPRLSRSPRNISDFVRPVKLVFTEKLPESLHPGMKVNIRIKRRQNANETSCQNNPPTRTLPD